MATHALPKRRSTSSNVSTTPPASPSRPLAPSNATPPASPKRRPLAPSNVPTIRTFCTALLFVSIGVGIGVASSGVLFHSHDATISALPEEKEAATVDLDLDPFPLPPCKPDLISAVYVFYGRPIGSAKTFVASIQSLRQSNFPGKIRVVVDETSAKSLKRRLPSEKFELVDEWQVEPLPDLTKREVIPHSNKIRALRAGALVRGTDSDECSLVLDTDAYAHPKAPWSNLFSTLQLNDVAVAKDCSVNIANVPEYLSQWMPNTGVLALRNTPRTRLVLGDWLDHYVPCNATHVETCTPGTDQYAFLQMLVKHAARVEKLGNEWNCRCEINREMLVEHPVYAMTVLSKEFTPGGSDSETMTCGGWERCHILHGHFLKYFS